jgi:hypothetical protein
MASASGGTVDGCQWLLSHQRYIATLKNLKLTLESPGPGGLHGHGLTVTVPSPPVHTLLPTFQ